MQAVPTSGLAGPSALGPARTTTGGRSWMAPAVPSAVGVSSRLRGAPSPLVSYPWIFRVARIDRKRSRSCQQPLRDVARCSMHRKVKLLLPEVMEEKFEIKRLIGKGSYGMVHEVVHRPTNNVYAIKSMRQARGILARDKQQAEIDVLSRLGTCLNICMLYDVFETPGHLHMVMELCTGGTLQGGALADGSHYSEARVAELMRDILRTVAQCHKCHVVHRDIKPENFLFHHKGDDAPLKAIDFGLAIYAPPGTVLTERCGTPHFMAPEVVNRRYGPEADVWSAGVTAYLLLSGRVPFAANTVMDFVEEDVFKLVLEEQLDMESGDWATVSDGAKDFVRKLLTRNPMKRPTAIQALQHPWVREGGEAAASAESKLSSDVVRRLQMYGTFGALKKAALRKLAVEIADSDDPQVSAYAIYRPVQVERLEELFYDFVGAKAENMEDGGGEDSTSAAKLSFQALRHGIEELSLAGGNHLSDTEIWEIASQMEGDSETCAAAYFDAAPGEEDAQLVCPDLGFSDLLASLLNWELLQERPEWRAMAEDLFVSMDTDNNGQLDVTELQALLPDENASDLKEMLQLEGATDGSICLQEFLDMLRTEQADSLELYSAYGSGGSGEY